MNGSNLNEEGGSGACVSGVLLEEGLKGLWI
eukprot:CAMPEP_0171650012 /NCGR_PEP_ID=MMETSP0990-20121206/37268_1 /TAXON_ID=483369 /ORGANISM="non described non described, Strain CCMP2098" /LENGTH=30 /DNA_ID= /DNA_START= /DNA_END= /DNA_ORIENTATION=